VYDPTAGSDTVRAMGSRSAASASSIAILLVALVGACGPKAQGSDDTAGDDGGGDDDTGVIDAPRGAIDATPLIDGTIAYPDAEPYDDGGLCNTWQCTTPVDDGCNPPGTEVCNNGTDDNCNGVVDEGCTCQAGSVQSCFQGPPGRRGVGSCVDGMQTCEGSGEFTHWGPCNGGITPSDESCDTQDNNCNGCVDDNPECCVVDLTCPGPGDMVDGTPYTPYTIDGTQFFGGPVSSWAWTITGGPCDQLFVSQGYTPTFTQSGQTTPTFTFTPKLSGDYTITVTMTLSDGSTKVCTFIVHIGGPGVRVELCWDTTGSADIDLHLHRPATTSNWFTTPDDCYYGNCAGAATAVNWGYPNSPQAQCAPGAPAAGCHNPRLDIDNISTIGKPENINVDNPPNGATFRVMVHYYGGSVVTHPIVNVYCGGHLKATYGQSPDLLTGFNSGPHSNTGLLWRVVDVAPAVTNGDTTDCTLTPLHPPSGTGYWVTNGVYTY
jgi:hypothetical protein